MREAGTLMKFGQQEHLLQFQDEGLLYMNQPQYFWEIEDEELRGDPFDCIAKVARGPKIAFTLAGKEVFMEGHWTIRMYLPEGEKINIFCMYALRSLIEGTFPVDERNFQFGEHALVLINPDEFMHRIEKTLKSQEIRAEANLVEYLDGEHTGEVGPFRKLKRFAYQSEWRLVCYHGSGEPRIIRIGSIKDISVIIRSDEVNKEIKVEFEQDGVPDHR
jgi:hypothetical protein